MSDKYTRVAAVINLDNIEYNMQQIINCINKDTYVYAIIKADGYGHGAVEIAKTLEPFVQVRGYGVATPEEAMQLVDAGIKKEILIIGYAFPYSYKMLIENDIRLTVFKEDTLEEINTIAKELNKKAHIHIKVDSGMGRIGILPYDDGIELIKNAVSCSNIEVEGIFTHFATSDEKNKDYSNEQFDMFVSFVEAVEDELNFRFKIKHCSNSAAIIDLKYANLDAVRAGIILYGLLPSKEVDMNNISLKPAMSIVSHITYIKTLPPNSSISYGRTYTTSRPTRIATIPVGYADGYQRRLSNKAYVLINGKKAPVVGRICMDQFMVDVTFIPECKEGDKVTLIGMDKDEIITVEELSDISEQLNYEFVCDIGKRVPRVYIKNNEYIK